ncbi:MAG: glycosyltransferase family 1 protein, partial [Microcoleus sp. SIO2G3]|nr:glycosyltransferase family 1 protein [Microcoleus sp. SIO2G3]
LSQQQIRSQDGNGNHGSQNQQTLLSSEVISSSLYLSSSKFAEDQSKTEVAIATASDLICFSHLRWDFVYQRPQHLFSRFAQQQRVFFVEEPIAQAGIEEHLEIRNPTHNVWAVIPHLPEEVAEIDLAFAQMRLLDALLADYSIDRYICWYYTPMAIAFSYHLEPLAIVYDCMDELSAFKGASPS